MRRLPTLLLCLALAGAPAAPAQPAAPSDRSPLKPRHFNDEALRRLQADRAFRYDKAPPPDAGLLQRIAARFQAWVDSLFRNPAVDTGFRILQWTVPALLLLYAVVRLSGMEKALPWRRDGRTAPAFDIRSEDVHTVDFPAEIARAVAQARYRDATRLQYLLALRHLADAGRIRWTPDKTNRDYASELEGTPLAASFREVTRLFECAWYGEMPVTDTQYAGITDRFNGLRQHLGT